MNYAVKIICCFPQHLQFSFPFDSKYSSQRFGLEQPKICFPYVGGETKDLHKYITKITVFINYNDIYVSNLLLLLSPLPVPCIFL